MKLEPGLIPEGRSFIKQEPGLTTGVSRLEDSRYSSSGDFPFLEGKPGGYCGNGAVKQERMALPVSEVGGCQYKSVKQEGEVFAAFPSQPLDLNFMSDIEDIVQPSNCGK
jgi:hypothetical protein